MSGEEQTPAPSARWDRRQSIQMAIGWIFLAVLMVVMTTVDGWNYVFSYPLWGPLGNLGRPLEFALWALAVVGTARTARRALGLPALGSWALARVVALAGLWVVN